MAAISSALERQHRGDHCRPGCSVGKFGALVFVSDFAKGAGPCSAAEPTAGGTCFGPDADPATGVLGEAGAALFAFVGHPVPDLTWASAEERALRRGRALSPGSRSVGSPASGRGW